MKVASDEILWRGVAKLALTWDEGTQQVVLDRRMYYLRPADSSGGLSVERACFYDNPRDALDRFVAVAAIVAGDVTAVGESKGTPLEIVPKEARPQSANIYGLPKSPLMEDASQEESQLATVIAELLLRMTHLAQPPDHAAVASVRRRCLGIA